MNATILTVTPSGRVLGLYTEVIPLSELGALHIERLTTIEFNNATQEWEVKSTTMAEHTCPVLFCHESRQRCLDWEQQQVNPLAN